MWRSRLLSSEWLQPTTDRRFIGSSVTAARVLTMFLCAVEDTTAFLLPIQYLLLPSFSASPIYCLNCVDFTTFQVVYGIVQTPLIRFVVDLL